MAVLSVVESFLRRPGDLLAASIAGTITYILSKLIYNIFFHPLRSFPGPISHAASRIPYCVRLMGGTLPFDILEMHKQYGDIVRVAPNELAFSSPDAWKEIMGNRKAGETDIPKFLPFYKPIENQPDNLISADRVKHGLLRRQLAHGFSEKVMREQEPIIGEYIDLFIRRLHEHAQGGEKPVDIMSWYNFTTFDVIGDLAFGEPFGCLENGEYHPFVATIIRSARLGTVLQSVAFFPLLKKCLMSLIPKAALKNMRRLSEEKLLRRIEMGKQRPDLIEGLLKKKDEWNMSLAEIESNASLLLIGGSETTATLLSGVTYYLLTNPHTLSRLTAEVRSAFSSEAEITLTSVNRLSYMLACLDEAMRMYPPVPHGLPRVIPKGGKTLLGRYIPEDTIIAIHQWATYHNDKHFADPFSFHPERFLGTDPRFAHDKRDALQPFHVGPRNCIGRNLAYAEMRLILARLVYSFDVSIAESSRGWVERQRIYLMWQKGPLDVFLRPRAVGKT